MNKFRERLQLLMDQKNINQTQLANVLGVNRSRINEWLNGKVEKPRRNTLLKVCEYFDGCNIEWLQEGIGSPPYVELPHGTNYKNRDSRLAKLVRIPVLGKVPAGIPQIVEENIESYLTIPGVPQNCYALKVIGESMEPGIKHGDYVLFVIDKDPQPGDIVVVNDDFGESMIKRLKEKKNEYFLVSDNPAYPTFKPNGGYRIMGVVVGGWRELNIK